MVYFNPYLCDNNYGDYMFKISKYKDSNVKLSIRLPESIDNTLRKIAIKEEMSYNNVLTSCIKFALDNMDISEYENVKLPERRKNNYNIDKK